MLDAQTLKARLQALAADDYAVPTQPELLPLVLAMGTHIGSPDPELRDALIYTTLATWIERDVFDRKQLNEILKVKLNEQHLFWGLGEEGTDTVFMRSFSMLVIALALGAHRRAPFLPDAEIQVIQRKVLRYLAAERDRRGYVAGKGWAHAVAHAADALAELAQCDALEAADLQALLDGIRAAVATPETVYTHEEDERLATAVLHIWRREEMAETAVAAWLTAFIPDEADRLPLPEGYYRFVNVKTFLRSLTFRTQADDLPPDVRQALATTLAHFHRF
jgi:hypothetical protein